MPPLRAAILAQVIGSVAFLLLAKLLLPSQSPPRVEWFFAQGACAALISHTLGAPRWWLPIHFVFLPLALRLNQAGIPPLAWLSGFVLLFLLFWRTDKSRVPLFLTNKETAKALVKALPDRPFHCIDLGCGTGSLLTQLAKARQDCHFVGIEHAPIPYLVAWLRSRKLPNLDIQRDDFWRADFRQYQVIYAFLSPIPMQDLWQKASKEMPSGALVISNSFIIPGLLPSHEINVADRRHTKLYFYEVLSANKRRDS